MAFKFVIFVYRKPGTSADEFKKYYEETHVPYMKELMGDKFPSSHVRRYVPRAEDVPASSTTVVPNMDCISELSFDSPEAMGAFFAFSQQPDAAAAMLKDCENFMDTTKKPEAFVVSDCVETKGSRG